jgi:hypothetical protein
MMGFARLMMMILAAATATTAAFAPAQHRVVAIVGRGVSPLKST